MRVRTLTCVGMSGNCNSGKTLALGPHSPASEGGQTAAGKEEMYSLLDVASKARLAPERGPHAIYRPSYDVKWDGLGSGELAEAVGWGASRHSGMSHP